MKTHLHINSTSATLLDKLSVLLRLLLIGSVLLIALRATIGRAESSRPAALSENAVSAHRDSEVTAQLKVTRDARGRKVQVVDFSDLFIDGQARTPDGFVIQSRKSGRFKSLVELRRHFRDNIKLHALDVGASPVSGE
jgi:hypothetical protein